MTAVDIKDASYSQEQLAFTVEFRNDTDQDAEGYVNIGGPGTNYNFLEHEVPANTVQINTYSILEEVDRGGAEYLITASLATEGQNVGDFPTVDEQRNVYLNYGGPAELSDPLYGGGGSVDSPEGPIGGSGGSDPTGDAEGDISIEITEKTTQAQYAWLSFTVSNTGSRTVEVSVSFSPDPWGGGETYTLQAGSEQYGNVEWYFDNTSDMNQQLCVEIESASYV